jgi:hypothetical protein
LRPFLDMEGEAGIDTGQPARGEARGPQMRQPLVAVRHQPIEGAGRGVAGDGVVERRRQAIDVRPWPLPGRGELFRRGKARRENRRHGSRPVGHRRARRPEIDQRRPAFLAQHDVGRLDVAVQEARVMHLAKARQQCPQHGFDVCRRQRPLALTRSSSVAPRSSSITM